jgi:hypothetical protein
MRPEPAPASAPPTPSSRTTISSASSFLATSMLTIEAPACLATFVSASDTT